MAIDSRIALGVQVPDTNKTIRGGLLNADTFNKMREDKKNAPLRNKLFQDKAATSELELDDATKLSELKSMAIGATDALSSYEQFGKQGVIDSFTNRINQGASVEGGRGMVDTEEALAYVSDPMRTDEEVKNYLTQAQQGAMKGIEILSGKSAGDGLSSEYRSFLQKTGGLSKEDADKALRVDLGLEPRAGTTTGIERIVGDDDMSGKVIDFEGDKAGTVEDAKLSVQLEIAPKIAEAKAQAAIEGADRGDDIVKLKFLDANMPNIDTTVNKLNKLNETATYTVGGKIADGVFRQLGFDVPEGATARAQSQALINTTILPLLKPTFGAAFTETEGKKLLDTWGDADASPEEKKMALEGMMTAVKLEAETIRRKLGKKEANNIPARPSEDLGDGFTVEFK